MSLLYERAKIACLAGDAVAFRDIVKDPSILDPTNEACRSVILNPDSPEASGKHERGCSLRFYGLLQLAARRGKVEIARLLFELYPVHEFTEGSVDIVMAAIHSNSVEMLELFLDMDPGIANRVYHYHQQALATAMRRPLDQALKMTTCLLDRNADPNYVRDRSPYPVLVAIGLGYLPVVRLLRDRGADLSKPEFIIEAARDGYISILQYLFEQNDLKAINDVTYRQVLVHATEAARRKGHQTVVDLLKSREAYI